MRGRAARRGSVSPRALPSPCPPTTDPPPDPPQVLYKHVQQVLTPHTGAPPRGAQPCQPACGGCRAAPPPPPARPPPPPPHTRALAVLLAETGDAVFGCQKLRLPEGCTLEWSQQASACISLAFAAAAACCLLLLLLLCGLGGASAALTLPPTPHPTHTRLHASSTGALGGLVRLCGSQGGGGGARSEGMRQRQLGRGSWGGSSSSGGHGSLAHPSSPPLPPVGATLGASLAAAPLGRRVVALIGDGSFQVCVRACVDGWWW